MKLNFAYSPCPNDTYAFYGIAARLVSLAGHDVDVCLHDIETLNQCAMRGTYEITKLSFHAWLALGGAYRLLGVGNALGYGCGPVLVARRPLGREELPGQRIVFPGEHTTAHLLFRLYCPAAGNRVFTTYDRIFSEILEGKADCGVVIHESRFLFEQHGLCKVCDLGQWWEETTGAPIPLGAIAVRRDLPPVLDAQVEQLIRDSLALVRSKPAGARSYIRSLAREMDDAVIDQHIRTFVNEFTLDLGERGRRAVARLKDMAVVAGILS